MMTRCAPIIHARTWTQDFPSQLLVRPEDFSDDDVSAIRSFILDATANLDLHGGPRWLVVDDGRCRVAGVACYVRDLARRAGAGMSSQKYFYDSAGRLSHAFTGVCVPSGACVLPNDADLWRLYETHIADLWDACTQKSLSVPYSEHDFVQAVAPQYLPPVKKALNITLYEEGAETDLAVFQQCLAGSGPCRFCSGLDFQRLVNGAYTIATASAGTWTELEEHAKKQFLSKETSKASQKNDTVQVVLSHMKNFIKNITRI